MVLKTSFPFSAQCVEKVFSTVAVSGSFPQKERKIDDFGGLPYLK
jgi:hypothetical protein